ncbi:MAG: 6-phosphofructokinase [Chloroflexi bacterium]|nr:6-phosphofructokinase [Chloroflexota bacterium]
MEKRIGVLTGGGDAPGQNVCLKTIVARAAEHDIEVLGVRKGWEGLLHYNPDDPQTFGDNLIHLHPQRVRDIDRMPGAFLHSSRLRPDAVPHALTPAFLKTSNADSGAQDCTPHILRVLEHLQLDALIVLGDRAALSYGAQLTPRGVRVLGIPKTVHNDINGTDYTLGFSTALGRGVRFIYELRAMAASREEIAVVEILGRTTGLTTMLIAYLAGADRLLIPEAPFDPAALARLLVKDKASNPSNYAILVVSEGASVAPERAREYLPELSRLAHARTLAEAIAVGETERVEQRILADVTNRDEFGFRVSGMGAVITEILENLTRQRMAFQPLSYLIRTGEPDGQDLLGAVNFATLALRLVDENQFGRLVAYRQRDNYVDVPLEQVTQPRGNHNVRDFYDAENFAPTADVLWAAKV